MNPSCVACNWNGTVNVREILNNCTEQMLLIGSYVVYLSEQHFTEGDEMEDDLDDDNIDYIIIEEIERSRKAI